MDYGSDSDSPSFVSRKRQKSNEGPDLISNLPDSIIGRILSFLSTKGVVRTSVLSKRWIYLWTFITELSFDDKEHYSSKKITKPCFVNSVYRVLLHLISASISSFSLTISEKYDPYHINQWLSAVSNRRVKKICVRSRKKYCNLPSYSLFKCQSLEELALNYCVTTVPTVVSLSSLTVLKLSETTIMCDSSSNDSNKLTLNFPALKKYEANGCTWSGVNSVSLQAPLLEVVSIENSDWCFSDKPHAEMMFCASRLTKFRYFGYVITETINLLDAHVASAEITVYDNNKSAQEMRSFMCKLLSINVQRLKLHLYERVVRAGVKDSCVDIPTFGMLVHLELDDVTGELLLSLLSKSPCLKTLLLQVLDSVEEPLNSAIVPDCFQFTLKLVKFKSFAGDENALSIAKFVIENAQVLERISFTYCPYLDGSKLEKAKEKLFSFKRSISLAVIEFSS